MPAPADTSYYLAEVPAFPCDNEPTYATTCQISSGESTPLLSGDGPKAGIGVPLMPTQIRQ